MGVVNVCLSLRYTKMPNQSIQGKNDEDLIVELQYRAHNVRTVRPPLRTHAENNMNLFIH